MVRTSDFQFENVGSNPSSPILNNFYFNNKIFLHHNRIILSNLKKINFNFYFISLISPFLLNNLRFTYNNQISKKKILVKQSYILLSWFFYLSFLQQKTKIKTKNNLKFLLLPISNKIFTLTKAPIAHKNWSKEQYKFQTFRFKICFNVFLNENNNLNSLNKSILFSLLTKKYFPQFETNLIFLKNISINYKFNDIKFLNYYYFFKK